MLTAISPWPLRATRMEESASGTEVPAEMITTPMTMPGMPMMQPALLRVRARVRVRVRGRIRVACLRSMAASPSADWKAAASEAPCAPRVGGRPRCTAWRLPCSHLPAAAAVRLRRKASQQRRPQAAAGLSAPSAHLSSRRVRCCDANPDCRRSSDAWRLTGDRRPANSAPESSYTLYHPELNMLLAISIE